MGAEKKKKPGRVVRLTPDLAAFLAREKEDGETISEALRRFIFRSGEPEFTLPSKLYRTLKEAKGAAVLESIRTKAEPEKPVKVHRDS